MFEYCMLAEFIPPKFKVQFISSTMDQAKNFLCVADTFGSGNVTNFFGVDEDSLPGSEIRKKVNLGTKFTQPVHNWTFRREDKVVRNRCQSFHHGSLLTTLVSENKFSNTFFRFGPGIEVLSLS